MIAIIPVGHKKSFAQPARWLFTLQRAVVVLLTALLVTFSSYGQQTAGSISGLITDASGAAVLT